MPQVSGRLVNFSGCPRDNGRFTYDSRVDQQDAASPNPGTSPQAPGRGRVRLGMHQYFAADHLGAAKLMAQKCRQREDQCVNAEDPPVIDFEIRSYALAAIMESVAFLEAAVNEFIHQVAYFAPGNPRLAGLDPQAAERIRRAEIEEVSIRRLRILEKYDVTLTCANKEKIDKGSRPGQDVMALIRARNALVHYKTEMHWDADAHRIETETKHLVPPNPLITHNISPWFPHHLLCAGVAEWAWQKSIELEANWQYSLGISFDTKSQPVRYHTPNETDDEHNLGTGTVVRRSGG
jgi:hypothetical protein